MTDLHSLHRLLPIVLACLFCLSAHAQYVTVPDGHGGVILSQYTGTGGAVVVPAKIDGLPVTSIGVQAFLNCTSLTSVILPIGVTSIRDQAFQGCTNLASVTIPAGVTEIDIEAFYSCSSLTTVTIPGSVKTIGNYAFEHCSHLSGVTLGTGLTSIGDFAFAFTPLKTLVIPKGVTHLGTAAFNACTSLSSVTLPVGVTGIGAYTFYGCYQLGSISLPNTLTSIGNSAFSGCSKLTTATIPGSVTSIGNEAFAECYALVSVTLAKGLLQIGDGAFTDCGRLGSITIPASVTSIGAQVFTACVALSSLTVAPGNTAFSSLDDVLFNLNKSTLLQYPPGKTSVTSYSIPPSVKTIGEYAFAYCPALVSVPIPATVTSIGDGAFDSCDGLTSATVPDGMTEIGDSVFANCSHLAQLTIPNSVTTIGTYAFTNCFKLTSVTLPDSITSIGEGAFSDCIALKSASFLGNAPTMGTQVFAYAATGFEVLFYHGSLGFTQPHWIDSSGSLWPSFYLGTVYLQTITFPAIANPHVGQKVALSATASSGLAVTYTVSGPAALSGNTLSITGPGVVVVTANQVGNAGYENAPNVSQTLDVRLAQKITLPKIANQAYGVSPITLQGTASSGLAPGYTVSGPATISGKVLTITGTGKLVVTANQAGNATYAAATPVAISFSVGKAAQTLTLTAPVSVVFGAGPIALSAVSTSGLTAMTYSVVSGPAKVSGKTVTFTGAGTVVIQARQPGSPLYLPATTTRTIKVGKATQSITFPTVPVQAVGATVKLEATSSSGLAVTYTVAVGPVTLSGTTAKFPAAGLVKMTANQAGNINYLPAPAVSLNVRVK